MAGGEFQRFDNCAAGMHLLPAGALRACLEMGLPCG